MIMNFYADRYFCAKNITVHTYYLLSNTITYNDNYKTKRTNTFSVLEYLYKIVMRIWSSGSLALSHNCLFWLILLSFLSPSIPASSSSVIVVVVMLLWHHCLPRARTMTTIRHEWTPPRFPRKGKKDTKWCYYRHSYYREHYLGSVFYPRNLQNVKKLSQSNHAGNWFWDYYKDFKKKVRISFTLKIAIG